MLLYKQVHSSIQYAESFHFSFLFCFYKSAGKGFWSEMLGVGDFYYELGVQIIEVCLALKHRNGGELNLNVLKVSCIFENIYDASFKRFICCLLLRNDHQRIHVC